MLSQSVLTRARRVVLRTALKLDSGLFSSCTATEGGTTTDADGDRIRSNATATLNCALGQEYAKGSGSLQDLDDSSKLPSGGALVVVDSFAAGALNDSKQLVELTVEAGRASATLSGNVYSASASAVGTLKLGEKVLTAGFEGTGSWTGNPSKAVDGDTAKLDGTFRLKATSLGTLPDADFVATVAGTTTLGVCAGSNSIRVKTADARIVDGAGNTILATIRDCLVQAPTYNGTALDFPKLVNKEIRVRYIP